MPEPHRSKSKSQQRLFGMIHSLKKGTMDLSKLPADLKDKLKSMAGSIKDKTVKQFASTRHKGLPNRVRKKKRSSKKDEALNQLIKVLKKEVIRIKETQRGNP